MTVLFLPLYTSQWPSSRQRVYNYIPWLEQQGWTCWAMTPVGASLSQKLLYGLQMLRRAAKADVVVLQKKILPAWLFHPLRLVSRRLIFDFDDNLFAFPEVLPGLVRTLKSSHAAIAGNQYLQAYAMQYSRRVFVIPTPVDCREWVPNRVTNHRERVIIGWIGLGGNLVYLDQLEAAFTELAKKFGDRVQLKVISDRPYRCSGVRTTYCCWSRASERAELLDVDIGVMPLGNDEISRGKCGFKALLYMSLGIPAVVSPVGMNCEIITDGVNGFLASSTAEWVEKLSRLVRDTGLRGRLGAEGRKRVEESFSYDALAPRFCQVLREVAA